MTTTHKSGKSSGEPKPRKVTPTQAKASRADAAARPTGDTIWQDEHDLMNKSRRIHDGIVSIGGLEPGHESWNRAEAGNAVGAEISAPAIGMVIRPTILISSQPLPSAENKARYEAHNLVRQSLPGVQGIADELGRLVNVQVEVPVPERAERLGLDVEQAIAEWAKMLPLFIASSVTVQEGALQRAALAYQPQARLRPVDIELLEMQKKAAESILGGTRWLTAAEVAQEANRSKSNPYALANRWKKEGRVFAIKYQGVERYPRYAFDEHMAPLPIISELLPYFAADAGGAEVDPWDIAAWFESANTYLDSARPRDRLDNPDAIRFAIENLNNMMHG